MAYEEVVLRSRTADVSTKLLLDDTPPADTGCFRILGLKEGEVQVDRTSIFWVTGESGRIELLSYFYFANRRDSYNRVVIRLKQNAMSALFYQLLYTEPTLDPRDVCGLTWYLGHTTYNNLQHLEELSLGHTDLQKLK